MLRTIRESAFAKFISAFIAFNLLFDLAAIRTAKAISGGPSQPEVQSFEPAGVNQMVDPFSGDFTYNIPLLDVGGYPVNLSYHSGIGMDQEASWTGLGWNVNPGTINRNMRGLPDDFNGDEITTNFDMKANNSWGVRGVIGAELFGSMLNLGVGLGLNYNTYKGYGYEQILNIGLSGGDKHKTGLTANLGLTGGSEGLSIGGNITYSGMIDKANNAAGYIGVGSTFSTVEGLKDVSFNIGYSHAQPYEKRNGRDKATGKVKYKTDYMGSSTDVLGHTINFTSSTYSPALQMPMQGSNISFSGKLGFTVIGIDATANISGYYSSQSLYSNQEKGKAYGYLYSDKGQDEEKALLDFNREKDGSYTREKPFLPLAYMTYDVYSVSGQGIGGVYRPYLNSVGIVHDPMMTNISEGGSLGVEIAISQLLKGGVDFAVNYTKTNSGKWTKGNELSDILKFKSEKVNEPLFEACHFKQAGEMSVETDEAFVNKIGGRELVKPIIGGIGYSVTAKSKLYTKGGVETTHDAINRTVRARRNQLIIPLTADQAKNVGLEKKINYYTTAGVQSSVDRDAAPRLAHHISQITALQTDGTSYVYGIPAYNTNQTETTFACEGLSAFAASNNQFVQYADGVDDVCKNGEGRGIDSYFNQKIIPAYAHSYLLTAICSPDYVDCDGTDGPSAGDYGNYTHFSYTKVDDYAWKTPYDKSATALATLNKGMQSTTNDDKASYVKGTKELWYLHSIETRTHIAIFYTSSRNDGKPNNGSASSLKLDCIKLFALQDFQLNGETGATPIKSVFFTYDYSLCKNVWNNTAGGTDNGKLTLKEVSFSYGKTSKSRLNKYTFNYGANNNNNPDYDPTAYDRWGNYQPFNSAQPNGEFPYSDQNPANANLYAKVWHLNEIKLPSGGAINIKYEADDYAFVMNKKAMDMITLHSINDQPEPCASSDPDRNKLFTYDQIAKVYPQRLYLIFKKPVNVDISNYLFDQGENLMDKIFYRFNINIGSEGSLLFETVSGYTEIDSYGNCSDPAYGYIKIKTVDIADRECSEDVNPISKAAWQYGQLYMMPQLLNSSGQLSDDVGGALTNMLSPALINDIVAAFKGQNKVFRDDNRGKVVDLTKSMLRLYNPAYKKYGGGSRVNQISILDNWNLMQSEDGFDYGLQYAYTDTKTFADGVTRTISSGVASYEPMLGNEENPWRMPEGYVNKKKWVADNDFYCEYPMGESFIPSANVGYSKVTVSNLTRPDVTRHATGKTVYEFYTAFDFPVFFDHSKLDRIETKSNAILSLLKCNVKNYVTAAQGFYIETNDMHGKPKAQYVFAEGDNNPISGISYHYSVSKDNPQRLDNKISTVAKDGNILPKQVATDYDLTIDSREQKSSTTAVSLNGNLASFMISALPWLVPTILGAFSNEKTKFNSVTATKVVNCYAIQDSTVAFDLGSKVTTRNILYDAGTGQTVLTSTQNEFNDPIYNFTYPAYWAYDRMGQAYENIGATQAALSFANGVASIASPVNFFVKGDEIDLYSTSGSHYRAWVLNTTATTITTVDKDGIPTSGVYSVKIIRSGRRNQQSLPAGSLVMMAPPLNSTGTAIQVDDTKRIIDAKATEYSDRWQMPGSPPGCVVSAGECSDCGYSKESLLRFFNSMVGKLEGTYTLNQPDYCYYSSYRESGPPTIIECTGFAYNGISVPIGTIQQQLNITLTNNTGTAYVLPGCFRLNVAPGAHPTWNEIQGFDGVNDAYSLVYFHWAGGSGTISILENCSSIYACMNSSKYLGCDNNPANKLNPYVKGLRGNWRPLKQYVYTADRFQNNALTNDNTDIRNEGHYMVFNPMWTANNGNDWTKNTADTRWTWSEQTLRYDAYGSGLESKDALERYSAAVYGYANKNLIAEASNAMYKEIGYEGFEDARMFQCPYRHFNFQKKNTGIPPETDEDAHTGWFSMQITNDSIIMERCMTPKFPLAPSVDAVPFYPNSADYIGMFSPNSGLNETQPYVISFWVKQQNVGGNVTDYTGASARVFANGVRLYPVFTKTILIDGWQQYTGEFTIPVNVSGKFRLVMYNSNLVKYYFDDIRICPLDGGMQTYVYDYISGRHMATLDANNFATFYEYDLEGSLIRTKKETERGIYTIQQSINHQSLP